MEVDGKQFLVPDFEVDEVRLGLAAKGMWKHMGADDNTVEVIYCLLHLYLTY
jgi:hypothetical protein